MRSLWSGAREAQSKVLTPQSGHQWSKDDQELWHTTLLEEKAGNLEGPFTSEELESHIGKLWIVARRSAVRQGEKLRPIDDFFEFGINAGGGCVRFPSFSRAIAALATSLLSLIVIEFFDDFTQVEPASSAASAQDAIESLLELLAWELSKSDEKRSRFRMYSSRWACKSTSLGCASE